MKFSMIAAATAMGLIASTASASTVDASYQVAGNPFGTSNLFSNVQVSSPGYSGVAPAGRFEMTSPTLGDFAAFCVDIYEFLQDDRTYDVSGTIYGQDIVDNIDRLFSSAYSQVVDGVTAAAFQISVWEIVYDTDTMLDLDGGNFFTVADANGVEFNEAVEAQADTFLAGLANAQMGAYDLTFMYNDGSQDIVTATPAIAAVPLPASSLLLLGAMGGLGALRRRKSA